MSDLVYRISVATEWEELQANGSTFGRELDKSSRFIHLSKLHQVRSTLDRFFLNCKDELYLLQIDASKLGDGLVYETVDGSNSFPHFYGPSRSFVPLPLDAVTKAEKLSISNGSRVLGYWDILPQWLLSQEHSSSGSLFVKLLAL